MVVAYSSPFLSARSSASLLWYLLHFSAIPPVVVNTKGVNVACSTSITLLAYIRFFSFSCWRYICLGLRQGRGRTLDCAWDFFCGRMIHRKLTSHPVLKQPSSPASGKIKIDGDSFVQLVSKMAFFFHRR